MPVDWASHFVRGPESSRRLAVRVAAVFGIVGTIWMVTSEIVVDATIRDPAISARVESALDWTFIFVAAAVIYEVTRRTAAKLGRTRSILSALVASIGDGLIVLGSDRRIVHANPTAVKMLGCEDELDLVGLSIEQFSHRFLITDPNGARVMTDRFASQQAFEEDGAFRYRIVLHRAAGDEVVVDATATGVRSRTGKRPALVVSMFHDVTDTEHLERLRDRLFSSTAHALKTPIAIIKANVQFATRAAEPKTALMLHAIERQCDRIDRLVHNLQVAARARSRSLVVHLRVMRLAPIVTEVAHELGLVDGSHAIELELDDVPAVYADRERLALVLRNLGHAALHDATPRSPIRMQLVRAGSAVELDVRYVALPAAARTFAGHAEYDVDALSGVANRAILEAHGGVVGETVPAERDVVDQEVTRWMRIPAMEDGDAGHLDRR